MSRWIAVLPLAALLALGALFYFFALRHDPKYQPHTLVGRQIPDITLPALKEGTPVSLRAAAAEGPMIVNFFASWCAPCEIEHPVLMGLKGAQVRVVGIAYKDAPPNSQAMLGRLGDPYAQALVDRDGRAGVEFGVTGVPETYVIARGGQVLQKHTGPMTQAEAEALAKLVR
ncbi:DsbE family thiol:disulfide interchange protein [uncultured Phenylobacterium sp.]|uniref:DsbE family thiol:disulfide interchange protein n=1 Tax=uncultured Phenylobacterium sp. TaxID=349273 RepID=UPI0025D8D8F2|nr:DsbE family thiol:disulfide interchange protein [uncultured Phenylobacterium sp.]